MTPPWPVLSPILAAGLLLIITVADPFAIESGGPTQTAISPTTAAGILQTSTVGTQGPEIGPPTCGTIPVTIGQVCISVILAAGGIASALPFVFDFQCFSLSVLHPSPYL